VKNKDAAAMALSFAILNTADYLTTKKLLKDGGEELNPIVRFFIKKKCFGLLKIVTTILGVATIYRDAKPKAATKTLISIYGLVVSSNINQIIQYNKSRLK
jgi:Na+/serine symporter